MPAEAIRRLQQGYGFGARSQEDDGVSLVGCQTLQLARRQWSWRRPSLCPGEAGQRLLLRFNSRQQIENVTIERKGLLGMEGERTHGGHLLFREERGHLGVGPSEEGGHGGEHLFALEE